MMWSFEKAIQSMKTKRTGIYKYTWLVSLEGYNRFGFCVNQFVRLGICFSRLANCMPSCRQYNGSIAFNRKLLSIVCDQYPERSVSIYF